MRASARITGAATAVAAAALLVGGCGSSGSEGNPEPPAADESNRPEGGGEGGGESAAIDAKALAGGWVTSTTKPDSMLIMAFAEKTVMLTGTASCTGAAALDENPVTLDLKCRAGSEDYAKGTVKSLTDGKLTVEWESGEFSAFTKATDESGNPKELPGGLPSGLPTDAAELGS